MSVKFEEKTIKTTSGVRDGMKEGADELAHKLGEKLTAGGGPGGYLAVSDAVMAGAVQQ